MWAFRLALTFLVFDLAVEFSLAELTCKQLMSEMTKKQLAGISACSKSMKFKNSKDKSAKMTCILRCVLIKEGMLSEDGRMDKETFDAFLHARVPESMKDTAFKVLGKCQEEHAPNLDPKDEFCQSYDPLIKCFMNAVMHLCPGT